VGEESPLHPLTSLTAWVYLLCMTNSTQTRKVQEMTKRPSVDFRALTISANEGAPEMDQETGRYRYRYNVSVRSDATGAAIRFVFHASIADYEAGKRGLAGDDLLWAFRCFVEDANAGEMSFAEFCGDFGYDEDSISARNVWRECRRASKKFASLWHGATEAADVLEELSERGVE